jgi:hypothetical protein
MLTNAQILDTLKQAFDYLSAEYSVKRIGIFGSCAKGQLTDKSDVDIIVEFERPLGLRFVEFAEYLENLLGRDVDILTPAGLRGIRIGRLAEEIAASVVYV